MLHKKSLRAFQLVVALLFAIFQFVPASKDMVKARSHLAAVSLASTYNQNFDSLPNTGNIYTWEDDKTLPGWYSAREGTTSSELYVSAGTSKSAVLFSYGLLNDPTSTDRALGSLVIYTIPAFYYGAMFVNDSGGLITALNVTYTGEQWRDGGNPTPGPHKLVFHYSLDASAITKSGTWTPVPELDFVSRINTPLATNLNGNLDANRKTITYSIPVSIPAGGNIWLRWSDLYEFGSDAGLAVDDLRVEAVKAPPDPAPSVLGTIPVEGASKVITGSPIQVAFSESVHLSAGYSLLCGGQQVALDLSGADTHYTFAPAYLASIPSGTNCTFTLPAGSVKDNIGQGLAGDFILNFSITNCGAAFTPIHDIQGSGSASPLNNKTITTEGVVTADLQNSKELSGFFIQAPANEADANPATSEGVFVSLLNTVTDVSLGDRLRLTGQVTEETSTNYGGFAAMTEISSVSSVEKCASGQSLPAPIHVILPDDASTAPGLERFEGMRVSITGPLDGLLTVQQNDYLGRFGQLTLASGGRVFQQNNGTGGSPNDFRRVIILDDGSLAQYPNPIPYYAVDGTFRAGDTAGNLVGILDQGRVNGENGLASESLVFPNVYYRLQPTMPPSINKANVRQPAPPVISGAIKVASFDVGNYFKTLDNGSYVYPYGTYKIHTEDLYPVTNTPRGADTAEELTRQKNKIVTSLKMLDADVVGLLEVETLNSAGALDDLVGALNASIGGAPTYAAVVDTIPDPDPVLYNGGGPDFVQVALIYKIVKVSPVGAAQIDANPIFDHIPVAQTFQAKANNEKFTVVVNHFKSRTDCPASGPDADQGDGKGCWNARRVQQAAELLNFVDTLKQVDLDVMVIGDLNAYSLEAPLKTLTGGGLIDQVSAHVPTNQRYSFVADGAAGYLDYALTTPAFDRQVTGIGYWHINADEPNVIDYNQENKAVPPSTSGSPDLFDSAKPYRVSEHDPLFIGLSLSANQPPQLSQAIADQQAVQGKPFSFTIPAGAFSDPDTGDVITLSATLSNGEPLPAWLQFIGATFSGTPGQKDQGTLSIKVIAKDMSGAAAEDTFDLIIIQAPNQVYLPFIGRS